MFILSPSEIYGILRYYNDDSFVSINKANDTIISYVNPVLLEYPKGYFYNAKSGEIEGPENTKIKIVFRKAV